MMFEMSTVLTKLKLNKFGWHSSIHPFKEELMLSYKGSSTIIKDLKKKKKKANALNISMC
jgi:hypothetical protein